MGLFDLLKKNYKIKASDVVEIIDHFPEFVFQNKKDLIRRKISLIEANMKGSNETFIKTLIKRHPDLFLK